MIVPDYVRAYREHLAQLIAAHGRDQAMEWIVGGQYVQIGILESSAVLTLGLQRHHTLVDVGCGSGRLPFKLKDYLGGIFVGTDILSEALDFAREKCGRADWRFIPHHEASIPVADSLADFVTFFSVSPICSMKTFSGSFRMQSVFSNPAGGSCFRFWISSANRTGPSSKPRSRIGAPEGS